MKIIDSYPDWVLKHKIKGTTVRLNQQGNYLLFKVSSKREKDKKYPVLIQKYIGIITESGILYKKEYENSNITLIEYGLSRFLYNNFRRCMFRHISSVESNDNKELLFICSIIYYLFNSLDDSVLKLTYLPIEKSINKKLLTPRRLLIIQKLCIKLSDELKIRIPNNEDLLYLLGYLRNIVIDPKSKKAYGGDITPIKSIIKEYNLDYAYE